MAKFEKTTFERISRAARDEPRRLMLTIAYHPRVARAGERAILGKTAEVSRLAPSFRTLSGEDAGPIDDPYVSRRPRTFSSAELDAGGEVVLDGRVVLLLHRGRPGRSSAEDFGLAGASPAIVELRERIARVAASLGASPVLLRGETGTGKELAARALHGASPRAGRPFVAVNMAAIPPSTAAAELFGHARGAFTGAEDSRLGYFGQADGGVLFLDEIGETPPDIQAMLLRVLESSEIQPVGGAPRKIDVAVIAATDAGDEKFRAPLYHRLSGVEIHLPPLRERREDIGLLFARFLADLGLDLDQTVEPDLRFPAECAALLLQHGWPGNVRELRGVTRRAAEIIRAGERVDRREVERWLGTDTPLSPPPPQELDLVAVLRAHKYQLNKAAKALGVSRGHLDKLIASDSRVRKAKDLTREEIAAAAKECARDVGAMAARLEVSPRGLKLRMTQLGL